MQAFFRIFTKFFESGGKWVDFHSIHSSLWKTSLFFWSVYAILTRNVKYGHFALLKYGAVVP